MAHLVTHRQWDGTLRLVLLCSNCGKRGPSLPVQPAALSDDFYRLVIQAGESGWGLRRTLEKDELGLNFETVCKDCVVEFSGDLDFVGGREQPTVIARHREQFDGKLQ